MRVPPSLSEASRGANMRAVGLLLLHLGRHLGVVLLEALAEALLGEHLLLDAAGDAAVLARRERLGGEVVDAGVEAVVNDVAEDVHELLDLALLETLLEHGLLGPCQAFHCDVCVWLGGFRVGGWSFVMVVIGKMDCRDDEISLGCKAVWLRGCYRGLSRGSLEVGMANWRALGSFGKGSDKDKIGR